MATRFVDQGTIPAGFTGEQLSRGVADGDFYAVDPTLASPAAFLTDNVGGSGTASTTWNGQTLPTGCSWNTTTGVLTVANTTNTAWNPTAGNYVAIGRTVRIGATGSSGGQFVKRGAGQAGVTNARIFFINCTIIVYGTPATWTNIGLGCFQDAASGADRSGDYGLSATVGGMYCWGCDIIYADGFNTSYALTETIGCLITTPQGLTGPGSSGLPTIVQGGRYVSSIIEFPRAPGLADHGYQVYGIPAIFIDMTLDNVYFANGGQWVNGGGAGSGYLIQTPNFPYLRQNALAGVNVNNGSLPYQFTNTRIFATTPDGWFGDNGTSSYTGANCIINWGGGSGEWSRGRDGAVFYQSIGHTFFSDVTLTTAIRNVRARLATTTPWQSGAAFIDRWPTTAPVTDGYVVAQNLLTTAAGILATENYSLNYTATAPTFTAGGFNALTGNTSATVGATVWNTNTAGQNGPAGQALMPVQMARTTALNTGVARQYQTVYFYRSFTHEVNEAVSISWLAATVGSPVNDIDGPMVAAADPGIKAAAVSAINATSTGNIDSYFNSLFTGSTNDVEDVYGGAKYLWYKYTGANSSVTGALLPTYNNGDSDFNTDSIVVNAAAATWVSWNNNTWTFKSQSIIGEGILAAESFTLNSVPLTAGTYAELTGTTITIPTLPWNTGIYGRYNGNLVISNRITGTDNTLLVDGSFSGNVNFTYTGATTSEVDFDSSDIGGNINVNHNTPATGSGLNIVLNTCSLTADVYINNQGTLPVTVSLRSVDFNGYSVLAGTGTVTISQAYTFVFAGTAGALTSSIRIAEFYSSSGSTTPISDVVLGYINGPGTEIEITVLSTVGLNNTIFGVVFIDGFYPIRCPSFAGSADTQTLAATAIPTDAFSFTTSLRTADNTFIAGSTIGYDGTDPANAVEALSPNTTFSPNIGDGLEGFRSKLILRRIMERNDATCRTFRRAIGLGTIGEQYISFQQGQFAMTVNTNTTNMLWTKASTSADTVSIFIFAVNAGGNNYDLGGTVPQLQRLVFGPFNPGLTVNLTPQNISDIAGAAANNLDPALTVMNDNIKLGSLGIPATQDLPE